jgi:3-hydroxyisobutyrate dehydrogenase
MGPIVHRPPHDSLPNRVGVAFLGLGKMGAPMAARVAAAFPLAVWNRTRERADVVASGTPAPKGPGAGITSVARTPRACAKGAAVVVTCVSDGRALEQLFAGEEGLLAGLEPEAVVVDMSTIGRAAAREAARATLRRGARFVDAPVSGSVGAAERGELIGLVGGADADVERVLPVLHTMCSRILRAGGVGQGQALKIVLNGLGAHQFVAFASMLALGERAGLPRETLVEAFTAGPFTTPSYMGKREKVLARDYAPEFALELALKDVALNVALQEEVGLRLPVQREIAREVAQAVAEGLGPEDLFAMEKYFAKRDKR